MLMICNTESSSDATTEDNGCFICGAYVPEQFTTVQEALLKRHF